MFERLPRRHFLALIGSIPIAGSFSSERIAVSTAPPLGQRAWLEREGVIPTAMQSSDLVLEVTRSDDFLSLFIALSNVRVTKGVGAHDDDTVFTALQWRLHRALDSLDAYITFVFPPQHVLEQRFSSTGTPAACGHAMDRTLAAPPIAHSLSQSSRFVFLAPRSFSEDHRTGIPLHLNAIVEACFSGLWSLVYTEADTSGLGQAPTRSTALEFPTRMQLAPKALRAQQGVAQVHPYTSADDVNISLTPRTPEQAKLQLPAPVLRRPVWSLDLAADGPVQLFGVGQRPIDDDDDACSLTKSLRVSVCHGPKPVLASRLRLGVLGTTASTAYQQDPIDTANGFASWTQVTQDGRDVSVVTSYAGWLYPFGLPASYVETFTRESLDFGSGNYYAYGICRATIVLQSTNASYIDADGKLGRRARSIAAESIEVGPMISPTIQRACNGLIIDSAAASEPVPKAFVALDLSGKMYRFTVTHHGVAGDSCTITKPLIFVRASTSSPDGPLALSARSYVQSVIEPKYHSTVDDITGNPLSTFECNGQPLTYVVPRSTDKTSQALQQHRTKNAVNVASHDYILDFASALTDVLIPTLANIKVTIPSVAQVARNAGVAFLSFDKTYLNLGLPESPDATEIYATLDAAAANLQSATDAYRTGIAALTLTPAALSRSLGTLIVDSAANAALFEGKRTVDQLRQQFPSLGNLFADNQARLFGLEPLSLSKLLAGVALPELQDLPRFAALPGVEGTCLGFNYTTSIPQLQHYLESRDGSDGYIPLNFSAKVCLPRPGDPSTAIRTANISLGAFTLPMLPPVDGLPSIIKRILLVDFNGVDITITGGHTTVSQHFAGIRLNPESAFQVIAWLDDLISESSPLDIDVDDAGIDLGLNISLPDVGAGAFTLRGVDIDITTRLPLDDVAPSFSLAVGSVTNPVTALLAFLGGGGWFQLVISPFKTGCGSAAPLLSIGGGANVSAGIDINLADIVEGYVQANAGVFFELSTVDLRFGGTLVISGGISAFHLISASMYVEIAFWYDHSRGNALTGEALYHVEVNMLFFSASFDAKVSYTLPLGSSNGGGYELAATKPAATAVDCVANRMALLR